jgi:hypothetical protein
MDTDYPSLNARLSDERSAATINLYGNQPRLPPALKDA